MSDQREVNITVNRTIGTGSNSQNIVKVDGREWARVVYAGRNSGWMVRDSKGYVIPSTFAETKDAMTTKVIEMIRDGRFPSPEDAWKNAVGRIVAKDYYDANIRHLHTLLAALFDFISLARDNSAIKEMNSFQRLISEINAIFAESAKTLQDRVGHELESLRLHESASIESYMGPRRKDAAAPTPAELQKAMKVREDCIASGKNSLANAQARLALAFELIGDLRRQIGE